MESLWMCLVILAMSQVYGAEDVDVAVTADRATNGIRCSHAKEALFTFKAERAMTTKNATNALLAKEAATALNAKEADHADNAHFATYAVHAMFAKRCSEKIGKKPIAPLKFGDQDRFWNMEVVTMNQEYKKPCTASDSCTFVLKGTNATNADMATECGKAVYAWKATSASLAAISADFATSAIFAGDAVLAVKAAKATNAMKAENATFAMIAEEAQYCKTAKEMITSPKDVPTHPKDDFPSEDPDDLIKASDMAFEDNTEKSVNGVPADEERHEVSFNDLTMITGFL